MISFAAMGSAFLAVALLLLLAAPLMD